MKVKTVGKIFNVSEETVRRWIRSGQLHAEINSRKEGYVINYSDMKAFVENKPKYEERLKVWRDRKMKAIKEAVQNAAKVLPYIVANRMMFDRLREERDSVK